MIWQVVKTSFISFGVGFLAQFIQGLLGSTYLDTFLKDNLINLLVALLAVNSATMGIVLTKIRDLVDKKGNGGTSFNDTKNQMLLSVKEQVALIAVGLFLLTLSESKTIVAVSDVDKLIKSILCSIFVYAMIVLYDTAKGVLIIVDFDHDSA